MTIKMQDLFKKNVIVLWKNDVTKRFYLTETNSMIGHVRNLFSTQINFPQFKMLKDDITDGSNNVEMSILEECPDKLVRRTRLLKYRNDLVAQGYTEYTGHTGFIDAKVKLKLGKVNKNELLILVYLVVRRKAKMILGVFDDMDEAKVFYNAHYPDGVIPLDKQIVISDNILTKQYASKSQLI